jgi:AcrR family transcriptional regulator
MRAAQDVVDTRERILDVAERLFAEHGYSNVPTRQITDEAGANTAAAHYHFGSKDRLLEAVFRRRLDPLNRERVGLIDDVVARADGRPSVEDVVRAFVEPTWRAPVSEGERLFRLLSGRASTDPNPEVRKVLFEAYDAVAHAFVEAVSQACPHLSKQELFWRIACIYGAMLYIRADNGRLQAVFGEGFSLSDPEGALRYALPFLVGGLSMPSADAARTSPAKPEAPAAPRKPAPRPRVRTT